MPAETMNATTEDLRDTSSDLYGCYVNDLTTDGFAMFTHEANARAFAGTFEAETGRTLHVVRNREGRWLARPPAS